MSAGVGIVLFAIVGGLGGYGADSGLDVRVGPKRCAKSAGGGPLSRGRRICCCCGGLGRVLRGPLWERRSSHVVIDEWKGPPLHFGREHAGQRILLPHPRRR